MYRQQEDKYSSVLMMLDLYRPSHKLPVRFTLVLTWRVCRPATRFISRANA